jgi:hypothetical protein
LGEAACLEPERAAGDGAGRKSGSKFSGTPCSCLVPAAVPLFAALIMFTAYLQSLEFLFCAVLLNSGKFVSWSVEKTGIPRNSISVRDH